MSEFEEGDVVQLKSGGPQMTIKEFIREGMVICNWFAEDELKGATFSINTIERVENNNNKNN